MSLINLFRKRNRKFLFTTPSHGQKFFIFNKFRQFYKHDISETEAQDPQTALADAQNRAAKIYGTNYTYFLTNGSTSGIIAAVLACTNKGDKVKKKKIAHPCHKNAVILAHYYVPDDVQEVADIIGESFYLSKIAKNIGADLIVFAGVSFMGESAKILNPKKKVLLPDRYADCAMAHMASVDKVKKILEEVEA